MKQMRWSHRVVVCAALIAASTVPPFAIAIDASQGSSASVQQLAAEARELLPRIQGQIRDVEIAMQRTGAQPGGGATMFSMSHEYRELKRSTTELSDISNKVSSLTSHCSDDAKKAGQSFRSSVRRLSGNINRMSSYSTPASAQMTLEELHGDLEKVAGDLHSVAGVAGCAPSSDDEDADDEAASKSDDNK
jgi:hypothetical protein